MKKLLWILLILVAYLVIGFSLTFVVGDHNFFEEYAINPNDARLMLFAWPYVLLISMLGAG